MDAQIKSDLLLAMAVGFALMVAIRMWPRIQAKLIGVPFIDTEEAKRVIDEGGDNVLVLDVRTPGEFTGETGHIPGALNLDSQGLSQKLAELGDALEPYKDQPIVVTCRTHNRSPKAARILYQNGFRKLMILNGGMMGWGAKGFPTQKG